jgi:hypothetical protein
MSRIATTPGNVVSTDSLGYALLQVAARAVRGRTVDDLTRVPLLGRHGGAPGPARNAAVAADARAEAQSPEALETLDPGAVAEWIAGHYPADGYPAVVLGSPHGAAVHLAAALGAPWLPAGFTVAVRWPDGRVGDWVGAAAYGSEVIAPLLARHPGVTVRQVHDPLGAGPRAGSTVTFDIRWRTLPAAYRRLVADRPHLLARDVRPWPVRRLSDRFTFQVGRPAHGWSLGRYEQADPAFRQLLEQLDEDRWAPPDWSRTVSQAEAAVDPGFASELRRGGRQRQVLYARSSALSATVADLYRTWLRADRDDCVVECDRLLDPWRVLAAGRTPYWAESASVTAADAAELWLAGSRPFDAVTVLPQPPGTVCAAHADLGRWRSIARFARRRGDVSRQAAVRYPELPLATAHAAAVGPAVRTVPPAMPMDLMGLALRRAATADGLMVV